MPQLRYHGSMMFRERIVASILSGQSLIIGEIRIDSEQMGLQDFEASFLRLVEKLTDGSEIEINETGTSLKFKPGVVVGGIIQHDCGNSRSMGWFIEGLIPLVPFGKRDSTLSLTGVTNDATDLSVDTLANVTLPLLQNFGIHNAKLKIQKRGAFPLGGGQVTLFLPMVRSLKSIHMVDEGLVKRIRGTLYSTKVSPNISARVIQSCRSFLNDLLPDVYIHTDHYSGKEGGNSPGYSLSLIAESTTGVLLSTDTTAQSNSSVGAETPENLGRQAAFMMLQEIAFGGVIDRAHQSTVLHLMALTPEAVSKIHLGALSDSAKDTLQLIRDAYGVTFKITETTSQAAVQTSQRKRRDSMNDDQLQPSDDQSDSPEDEESDDAEEEDSDQGLEEITGEDFVDEEDGDEAGLRHRDGSDGVTVQYERKTVFVSCYGIGYANVNRRVS